jgi:hypothetical protein
LRENSHGGTADQDHGDRKGSAKNQTGVEKWNAEIADNPGKNRAARKNEDCNDGYNSDV